MNYKLNRVTKEKFFAFFFVFLFACSLHLSANNSKYPTEDMGVTSIISEKPFTPGISLAKMAATVDASGAPNGCAFIEYTFTVTNESDSGEILENVVIVDEFLGAIAQTPDNDPNNDGVMDPGEIWIYTVLYEITLEDIDNDSVGGVADVTADVQGGGNVNDQSDDILTDLTHCQSDIALIKNGAYLLLPDAEIRCDAILYVFSVSNEGFMPLENIEITDPILGVNPVPGPPMGDDNNNNILDLNETWIYQIEYNVTEADKIAGEIVNQASVTANIENTNIEVQDLSDDNSILEDDPTVTDISSCPPSSIALIKNGAHLLLPDAEIRCDAILYVFTVSNEGSEPLENIEITDPILGVNPVPGPPMGDDNNDNILDLNETWIYQIQYNVTQEDINLGEIVNQATVTANIENTNIVVQDLSDDNSILEDDPTVTDISSCQNPSIGLIKEGVVVDIDGDGCVDSIRYTLTVTNTGNVDLVDIIVEDPLLGGEIYGLIDGSDIGNDNVLSVGEEWIYEVIYAITQLDIDNGSVINQATVTALTFANIPVSDLSDNDSLVEDEPTRTPVPDDACTEGSATMGLIKTGEAVDIDGDGCIESILYTFTLTNTGGADIDEITLEDELLGGQVPGPVDGTDVNNDGILSVGETWTYQGIYAIKQVDIDNGSVINQATVNGEIIDTEISVSDLSHDEFLDQDGPTRTPVPDDACTEGSATMGLIKTGEAVDIDGDGCIESILYTFTLTNTGGAGIDEITLEDELLGGEVPGPVDGTDVNNDGILSVGETWTYEAIYAIEQVDIDNGSVINQATVNGEVIDTEISVSDLSHDEFLDQDGPTRTPVPDDACTEGSATMGLIKTGEAVDIDGDGCIESILYTFTLTNTGGVDINEITLEDLLFLGEIPGPQSESIEENGVLQVNETWTYVALYGLSQEDIDNAIVINQATVNGEIVNTEIVVSDLSHDTNLDDNGPTQTVVPNDACPGDGGGGGTPLFGIAVIKTGLGVDADLDGCDDSIVYNFSVINTGSINLENIVLDDELLGGPVNGLTADEETEDGILQPGEEWIFTATYNLTQEDIDGIFVDNQAIVTADLVDSSDSIFDNSDDNSYLENDITTINVSSFCEFTGGGFGFEIFNGITPNGDGMNDFFKIQGIENYPDNNVKIFNRWGVQVYEINSYGQGNNLFYGISEGRATLQQERELPSGTYFYMLTFTSDENPGEESYSGYLYINRD